MKCRWRFLWAVAIVAILGFQASSAMAAIACYYQEKHADGSVGEALSCYEKRDECPTFPGSGLIFKGSKRVEKCKLELLPSLTEAPAGLPELEEIAVKLESLIDAYYEQMEPVRDFQNAETPLFIPATR